MLRPARFTSHEHLVVYLCQESLGSQKKSSSMSEFSKIVIGMFSKRTAPDQGGLLTGKDPSAVNLADPIRLWIIQVGKHSDQRQ